MSIELVIDNRENDLISKFQNDNKIIIEQLEVGDIIYRQNGEIILIIERKTVKDLKASICDGRAREQKARLIGTTPIDRILYLIEGDLDKKLSEKINGLPVSTLIGSLINTQLRDGIKVYKTSSIDESVEFLQKLFEKIEKDGNNYFKNDDKKISNSEYASTLKKSKKANMTPEIWFISQLSLIPQVTEKIASVITEKYKNVKELIIEYERTPEHLREKLLADLPFKLANGKNRRIGDKISMRIYNFFYNT
jgi:ERCC4-type nuclease